ncbi:MAG: HEAT repeat domain-containing protein [Anaerolineae bacterium]|nr:HEAT repeat domain-containing protein [Anaerolineae bacterium]
MSAVERMIAYHLARLKDKNPQIRIASIEELALLEATQAYSVLEDLYHNDPDEDVRQAAKKAGRVLFLIIQKENANPPDA